MTLSRITLGTLGLAATLFGAAPVSAQLNTLGFQVGLGRASQVGGFADLIEDVGGTTKARTGIVASAYVDYGLPNVHDMLSIQAGLGIAQKGTRIPPDGGLKQRALDITYVEIPVLAKATISHGLYRPYVVAGPVLALKMSAGGEVDGESVDADDEVKGTDLGFALGVGGRRGPFGLELRYTLGLVNITESTDPQESAKNRQWGLVASYEIPFPW